MKNWRELGEVPDSDDEDFDEGDYSDCDFNDIDLQTTRTIEDAAPTTNTTENQTASPERKNQKTVDIWDVPSSQPNPPSSFVFQTQKPQTTNLSEPPSPVHVIPEDGGGKKEGVRDECKDGEEEDTKGPTRDDDAVSTLRESPKKKTAIEVLESYLENSPASSLASLLSRTPSPPASPLPQRRASSSPKPRETPVVPIEPPKRQAPSRPQDIPVEDNDDELARRTAVRLDRSLRPRKPIQQHPYLLENAQYTTFMKSHGVRPIRVVQPSQPPRKDQDEDSQEQEFQADESQEANERGLRDIDDSGPILFDDDDEDELSLSPSHFLSKTSPATNVPRTSSQQTHGTQTDVTSMSGEEEFPDIDKIKLLPAKKGRSLKRQRSQQLSTSRKRLRVIPSSSPGSSPVRKTLPPFIPPPSIWDLELDSSPPEPRAQDLLAGGTGSVPQSPVRKFSRTSSSAKPLDNRRAPSPIIINEDSERGASDAESASSGHTSDSESDVIRENVRRIRGVLPASWLRLNQQTNKVTHRQPRRSREPSLEPVAKRGVAQVKSSTQKPPTSTPFPFFDESDESDGPSYSEGALVASTDYNGTATRASTLMPDDGGSAEEEDVIDWMLPSRKRSGPNNNSGVAKRRKKHTQSIFKGVPGTALRQPKITQALDRVKHSSASNPRNKRPAKSRARHEGDSSSRHDKRKRADTTPPLLSILDVIEPGAPKFIKIAARAAKKSKTLGKSSPSRKIISLANRNDNFDALSTLRDWKSGKTRPKFPAPPPPQRPEKGRPVLREISTNASHGTFPKIQSKPKTSHPRKIVRQTGLDGFVTVGSAETHVQLQQPTAAPRQARPKPQERVSQPRPAQLEVEESEDRRRQLAARKRKLDAFYRRTQGSLKLPTTSGSIHSLDLDSTPTDEVSSGHIPNTEKSPPSVKGSKNETRTRYRKGRQPRRIDTDAPQYTRANDPLPSAFARVEEIQANFSHDKLQGLGPYGTHYTQHFEIFPLEIGVYFHESTVIGRGFVRKAIDSGLAERLRHQKASVSFVLDDQTLRWSTWDDTVSSELGIVIDWISEQLTDGATVKAVSGAEFVMRYIIDSLSVQSDLEEKAFVTRCLEVFLNFSGRLDSANWVNASDVITRLAVALSAIHSISQAGNDFMIAMKVEDLLKKFASAAVRHLLAYGLEELRDVYGNLQQLSFRERGIRSDRAISNCWVVMTRVLENAHMPRCGFWDIVQTVMLTNGSGVAASSEVPTFERLWEDMFTLLPLCEIDNSGVLQPGWRKTAPIEGWSLPRKLMERVFELYKSNPRQPPSFNEYCRALVARCHFLVQQWGWRKCTAIIGVVFDFFGSQNLANLRNEEVYKSPRFLEELGSNGNPSLMIEPEDRCFHIFIKLLALAIQRLKQVNSLNDIRNLVARTLPNHNRQYLKEDIIHQHDLAALRNHHDLLCTLFWVAPSDMRPAVHLIEKLVTPGSAHKEACLINVRAWNQLARFVMANGEGHAVFKPFAAWRDNVFNQVLDQYLSAASDIEQQFRALSSESAGITKEMRDDMIARNKATALDVLFFSARASLDVLRRAPSLEAAVFALNTAQLQKIFTSLDFPSTRFDWGVLRVALETLDHFLDRIEQASDKEFSIESTDDADSAHVEDAVLLINRYLTKDFFWMCRTVVGLPLENPFGRQSCQAICIEKTVTLGAKIAARFIKDQVTSLASFFTPGKYALFSSIPKSLASADRKYFPLFLSVLLKNHMFDFRDLGLSILGLWVLCIIKPMHLLAYENFLAEELQRRDFPFLENATVAVAIPPDYNSNRDFFLCAIRHMRKTMRESRGSAQSRLHRDEFSKILQLAMQNMKQDLSLLRPDTSGHEHYIEFVRHIISTIKSYGVNICIVDSFFTQPSLDYSPPMEDPGLQLASIVAYGVRLSEGDDTAIPQLFHYLYLNFKTAVINGKLEEECRILSKAMRTNKHIMSFMLKFMLPAILKFTEIAHQAWVLLEVYRAALETVLTASTVPKEIIDDEDIKHVMYILPVRFRRAPNFDDLSEHQLHLLALRLDLINLFQPSLKTYLFNNMSSPASAVLLGRLRRGIDVTGYYVNTVLRHFPPPMSSLPAAGQGSRVVLSASELLEDCYFGVPRIHEFSNFMLSDYNEHWERGQLQVPLRSCTVPQRAETIGRVVRLASEWKLGSEEGLRDTRNEVLLF
ncbi:Mus7/MMS22 family-domain-containing protein [Podospora australis]|uniref:Mus7/MMS22 family-domain-containing protein n=1 Tax=Podospora australis TaxID=1536484 RepID=A0AAN7AIU7_9PEZI|nr:Mus7/MMS22 family-domain-containing protein [Podospora australis]